MQAEHMLPLDYPEAAPFKLFRNEEGIVSKSKKRKFIGLVNYPTTVQFSGRAVQKMHAECEDYNHSSIDIYANFKSGKKISLFTINSNFFGKVKSDRDSSGKLIDYEVAFIRYNSADKSFSSSQQEAMNEAVKMTTLLMQVGKADLIDSVLSNLKIREERSFPHVLPKDCHIDQDDVVTSFGATYSLGYGAVSLEKYEFSVKFSEPEIFTEKIGLKIDVKDNDDWDLTICQRNGTPLKKVADAEKAAICHEEKEREVPQYFICPITQEIMQDPVIGLDGNSYERSAIEEWLAKSPISPLTRQPMGGTLIPNRQLKEAIDSYKKGS